MLLQRWKNGLQNYFIRPRRLALVAALISLLVGLPIWYSFQRYYANHLIADMQQLIQTDLSTKAETLKTEFDRRLGMAETLRTFTSAELEAYSQVDPMHLQSILQGLYQSARGIEFFCLELSENDLILFPETNKSRQSYTELEPRMAADWGEVQQTDTILLQGPYLISTGQRMLIARGIVLRAGQAWGSTSAAFDLDLILAETGLADLPDGWALLDGNGNLMSGRLANPAFEPLHQNIPLLGGNWQLLAAPPEGWMDAVGLPLPLIQWGGLVIVLLVAALVSTFFNRQERLRKSVDEKTHQLAEELAERQRVSEALQQSEEQSRLIVESALDAIFIEDLDGRVLDCNEFACKMYGYSRAEMLQLKAYDLIPPNVANHLPNFITQEVLDGLSFTQSFGVRKNGEAFPTEVNLHRVNFGGQTRVIVFVRDLTERQQEQRLLAESEIRYSSLMEILPEGVVLTDLEGVVLFCNQRAAAMHEFSTPDELIGCSIFDLIFEKDRPQAQKYLELVRSQGTISRLEIQLPRRNGNSYWAEVNVTLVPGLDNQQGYLLGVERDITARQQVRARQKLQTTALEAAANGIVITDLEGLIQYVNPAFTRLTGYSAEEAIGQSARILNSGVHPEEFFAEMWREILAGRVWSRRVTNRRKEGSLYIEEMTITPVFSTTRDDQPARITHFIAIKQDVTDREQDERRQSAIATLTSALRLATSRSEIIETILIQARELLDGHGAALMMRNAQDGRLICEKGVGAWQNWKGIQVSGQTGATARVLVSLQPFVENNVPTSQEPLIRRIFNDVMAVVCIPLIAPLSARSRMLDLDDNRREQVMGTLWLGRNRPFMDGEIRVLVSIADIAASAVQRAALYDETRQRLQRLMAIHALDTAISASLDVQVLLDELLHQLTGDLGVDAADVMLISPDGWTLACAAAYGFKLRQGCSLHEVRLGEGLVGRAALERKTLLQTAMTEEYPPVELERLAGEEIISRIALPMLAKGELKGVLEVFYRRSMDFDPEWLEYLETLAGQAAIAIDNAQLFDQAQRSSQELSTAYDTTLEGWARALELRDRETEGHTRRAAELTIRLGQRLGMSEDELVHVWRGALLHDIGKLGIPDDILSKPGALTDEEWEVMREHPRLGYELLKPIPYLHAALEIPWCHHERWNGSGYPRGLKGEEIPMAARIFAVADVWDALRSDRPYRPAWESQTARAYIVQHSGIQFDPQVVEVFEHLLDEDQPGE